MHPFGIGRAGEPTAAAVGGEDISLLRAARDAAFEAAQAAGIPGGGITVGLWMQILMQFDREGAFKNG